MGEIRGERHLQQHLRRIVGRKQEHLRAEELQLLREVASEVGVVCDRMHLNVAMRETHHAAASAQGLGQYLTPPGAINHVSGSIAP